MPNYVDDGDFTRGARSRSARGGAVRKKRRANPVYCEFDYQRGDVKLGIEPDFTVPDDQALCAKLAVRHTDPPRCTDHGGVNAAFSRKRTEAGYVRVSPRMRELIENPSLVHEMDDEELVRGEFRGKDGKFHRGPQLVPKALHAKMTEELFKRANDRMKTSVVEAAEVLVKIMKSEDADVKDQMKAAQWLIERVMGKTPEVVQLSQDKPWQTLLTEVTQEGAEKYEQDLKNPEDDRF